MIYNPNVSGKMIGGPAPSKLPDGINSVESLLEAFKAQAKEDMKRQPPPPHLNAGGGGRGTDTRVMAYRALKGGADTAERIAAIIGKTRQQVSGCLKRMHSRHEVERVKIEGSSAYRYKLADGFEEPKTRGNARSAIMAAMSSDWASIAEVAKKVGISVNTTGPELLQLKRDGLLDRKFVTRTLRYRLKQGED